jgi:hypothetical protein
MAKYCCRVRGPATLVPNPPNPRRSDCRPSRVVKAPATGLATDLDVETLRRHIVPAGSTENVVRIYVVCTVCPVNGLYVQKGSGPNLSGGSITLCTCKHQMRARYTPCEWKQGVWVVGFTSWDKRFNKQQSLFMLMRVGEAYSSHAELVDALQRSGRSSVVSAKDSRHNELGDLMMPIKSGLAGADRFAVDSYHTPMVGHAHHKTAVDYLWHDDVSRPAAVLVGDPDFSFKWTRAIVRRRNPDVIRDYYNWSLDDFLANIEAVPS